MAAGAWASWVVLTGCLAACGGGTPPPAQLQPATPEAPAAAGPVERAPNSPAEAPDHDPDADPTVLADSEPAHDGQAVIRPDDADLEAMAADGKTRLVGVFRFCLDERGVPDTVTMVHSTGYPGYDRKLTDTIRSWRYQPHLVDGKPKRVCAPVTFIYTRKD